MLPIQVAPPVSWPRSHPSLYESLLSSHLNYRPDPIRVTLNAVAATDTYSLYNTSMGTNLNIAGISRSGSSGSYTYSLIGSGDHPVTYVSWFDAARFSNWVANGQTTGAQGNATTENGAYTLNGATSGTGFTKNAINPNNGSGTTFWLPSEDEWYKAAYYSPGASTDSYWLYPMQSDTVPGNVVGAGANQANYKSGSLGFEVYSVTQSTAYSASQNYLTDGGAFSSSAKKADGVRPII
jgi:sulfatase modifying factor 1